MAESILKYEAGRAADAAQTDRSGQFANAQKALAQMGKVAGDLSHQNDLIAIRESQKAAETDILQNTIDPDRVKNDEAYAGVTLRNELYKEAETMLAEVQNPGSDFAKMDPEQFAKELQNRTNAFYKENSKSKFSETQAEIFSRFSIPQQRKLVALHAQTYKGVMKEAHGRQALDALSKLPPGEGEDFAANTQALIDDMLPEHRFTSDERLNSVVAAARAAASNGDRRLLDWAKENMQADILLPAQVAAAESGHLEFTREQEDAKYQAEYLENEKRSMLGGYTKEQWEKDMQDTEKIRRWGRQTMTRWYKKAHKEHIGALTYKEYDAKFKAGLPMTGIEEKMQQKIYGDNMRAIMEKAAQSKDPNAKLNGIKTLAGLVANQGVPYKELKQNMDSLMARPVWTQEAFGSQDFQDSIVIFNAFKEVMKPEQLKEQFGPEATHTAFLANDAMKAAGGDPEKASAIFVSTQQELLKRPELPWKHKADARTMTEDLEEIMSGEAESSDPDMRSWGRQVRGKTATMRTQLEYEYNASFGAARARGISAEGAREIAKLHVAAGAKVFGNELIWTGGASINSVLGFHANATADDRDKAWDMVCDDLGLDPDEVSFKIAGPYAAIVGKDGLPVHGKALVPLGLFGERYNQVQADEAQKEQTANDVTHAQDIAKRNRLFEAQLNQQFGDSNDTAHFLPGITLGEYRYANEDERTRMRSQYDSANRGIIGNMFKHIFDAIAEDFENAPGDAAERWKTKSWAYTADGKLDESLAPDVKAQENPTQPTQKEGVGDYKRGGKPMTDAPETAPASDKYKARGLRNNNPGNIRLSKTKWQGKIKSTDDEFEQFKTPELGIRAMATILKTYKVDHGIKTIQDMINRWAPAEDNNDPVAYAKFVAKEVGLDPNQEIDLTGDVRLGLVKAMIRMENGAMPYSDKQLKAGVKMAPKG